MIVGTQINIHVIYEWVITALIYDDERSRDTIYVKTNSLHMTSNTRLCSPGDGFVFTEFSAG